MSSTPATPKETAKSAQAFADYVAMGPSRTRRGLADVLLAQGHYKTSATAFAIVSGWSSKYHWQQRIADAATTLSTAMLEEAAELDADTFLETSRLANQRIKWTTPHNIDVVLKVRDSVRKPAPKGASTSVNVTVSVEVRQQAERLADRLGIPVTDLLTDAQEIAVREWEKV